jgi:hypothetical protein
MDTFSLELTTNLSTQTLELTGLRSNLPTSLWIQWQTFCAEDWYGSDCETFCVAQDILIPPVITHATLQQEEEYATQVMREPSKTAQSI